MLTERLYQAEVKATLDFSTSDSSLFVIAVTDQAIEEIAREIILPEDSILVHTSGSKPLEELQFAASAATGVFYPLQTFSKSKKIDFKGIPILVESNSSEAGELLTKIGKALSNHVYKIGSEERKALHVAAVIASNFVNHLLTLSADLMKSNNLEFEWLHPLIRETINKALTIGPENAQTGPAVRGDLEILDNHMDVLREDEAVSTIYKVLSQHIIDYYQPD